MTKWSYGELSLAGSFEMLVEVCLILRGKKHCQDRNQFAEMRTPHIQHMHYQTESKQQTKERYYKPQTVCVGGASVQVSEHMKTSRYQVKIEWDRGEIAWDDTGSSVVWFIRKCLIVVLLCLVWWNREEEPLNQREIMDTVNQWRLRGKERQAEQME